MYGKVFESIFDSTLSADGGWLPTYVFMSMIVLADKDGIVDVAPKALYRRLGFRDYDSKISYEDFESALQYLTEADPHSRSPDHEGRRIIPLSQVPDIEGNRGWLLVNYVQYRDKGKRDQRANDSTERVKRFRERQKNNNINNDVTPCNAMKRGNAHIDTDTDTYTDTDKDLKAKGHCRDRFPDFWGAYPKKRKKKPAREIWKRKKLDLIADNIVLDILNRLENDGQWTEGYIPDPTTYLNQERWEDEVAPIRSPRQQNRKLTYAEQLAADARAMGILDANE